MVLPYLRPTLPPSPHPERPCPPAPHCVTPLLSSPLLSSLFVMPVEANCVAVRAQPELPFFRARVLDVSIRYRLQRRRQSTKMRVRCLVLLSFAICKWLELEFVAIALSTKQCEIVYYKKQVCSAKPRTDFPIVCDIILATLLGSKFAHLSDLIISQKELSFHGTVTQITGRLQALMTLN